MVTVGTAIAEAECTLTATPTNDKATGVAGDCSSLTGHSLTGLPDATYTLSVRVRDAARSEEHTSELQSH